MAFNTSQSQRLKFIRSVAVCLILMSHISKEYVMGLEQWTNIGAQMFLAISGFIFGQLTQVEWKKWVLRRVRRIIPSYYIILFMTAILYCLFASRNIVDLQYIVHFTTLHFLVFPNYPFWGEHLWYITAIVLCYVIFPVLFVSKRLNILIFLFIYFIVVPSLLLIVFYKTSMPYRLSGYIYCFILAFAVAHFFRDKPPAYLGILLASLSLIMTFGEQVAIQNKYWHSSLLQTSVYLLYPWKYSVYGLAAFLLLYLPAFDKLSNNIVVDFLDKYSYEIYLAHKNFILGTLSLLYISSYTLFNVLVAIVCSLLFAFIVNKMALAIQNIITKQRNTSANRVKGSN